MGFVPTNLLTASYHSTVSLKAKTHSLSHNRERWATAFLQEQELELHLNGDGEMVGG